jgi:hypothetical protein
MLALLGSPWLFIGFYLENKYPHLSDSWFTGFWGLLYITGWMCSVIGLRQMKATGTGKFGKAILWILLVALLLADISNVMQLVLEKNKPSYFFYIDLFWPLSNIIMLIVGITVIIAKRLQGWKRYIPFATGLWFPLAMSSLRLGNASYSPMFVGLYSAITWFLLAMVVMLHKENPGTKVRYIIKPGEAASSIAN